MTGAQKERIFHFIFHEQAINLVTSKLMTESEKERIMYANYMPPI